MQDMRSESSLQSAKLGNMPIGKLIFVMSGPAILSMLVQALYNIVDSIFIGAYDAKNGVLALSYALPMQLLVNAFAIGIAVGTGSLISRLLGEGKNKEASLASQTGIMLALIISAVFAIAGYFVSEAFIRAYTLGNMASADADMHIVYEMSYKYLSICTCCCFGMMIEIMLNRILQAMGNMICPMASQLAGALTNIVLDPIFISVIGLGAIGAAVATVIGQIVAMCVPIVVIIARKKKWDIDIFFKRGFKPQKRILSDILRVGLPTVVMNSIGSVMYMIANLILNSFSDAAVWSFGVYFKLQSFAFMPVFGLNQGCIPIMGYNYGANNRARFDKTFRSAMLIALIYMFFALCVFHAMPGLLLKLFSVGDNALRIAVGTEALRLCSICFIPAAFGVIMIAMFNAVGHGVKAMLISLLRQIGILIPLGFVLAKYSPLGLTGFWTAFPIAEATSVLIFIPICISTINKIFAKKAAQTSASASAANALDGDVVAEGEAPVSPASNCADEDGGFAESGQVAPVLSPETCEEASSANAQEFAPAIDFAAATAEDEGSSPALFPSSEVNAEEVFEDEQVNGLAFFPSSDALEEEKLADIPQTPAPDGANG